MAAFGGPRRPIAGKWTVVLMGVAGAVRQRLPIPDARPHPGDTDRAPMVRPSPASLDRSGDSAGLPRDRDVREGSAAAVGRGGGSGVGQARLRPRRRGRQIVGEPNRGPGPTRGPGSRPAPRPAAHRGPRPGLGRVPAHLGTSLLDMASVGRHRAVRDLGAGRGRPESVRTATSPISTSPGQSTCYTSWARCSAGAVRRRSTPRIWRCCCCSAGPCWRGAAASSARGSRG